MSGSLGNTNRDRFTYRTPCKDDRRARYVCTQQTCRFRVTGNKDRRGRITVKVVNRQHTCNDHAPGGSAAEVPNHPVEPQNSLASIQQESHQGDDTAPAQKDSNYRNPATQMKWLVTAIERVLDVTEETKPHDIQAAAKEYYNESISYQQAFRCLRLLTADIKEQGHRERVPDELRKAIVTLRVFVDPPMDWIEIERKTGIKARTAGYIFTSAEKKSGGSKDPLVLLKNATISASGPKVGNRASTSDIATSSPVQYFENGAHPEHRPSTYSISKSPHREVHENQSRLRKRRKQDDMIDPNLDVSIDLAPAASKTENENVEEVLPEQEPIAIQNEGEDGEDDGDTFSDTQSRADNVFAPRRIARLKPTHVIDVEERVFRALSSHK